MSDYIVYDGRANYDPDDACIMEVFTAKNDKQAIKEFKDSWEGHDCVLMDSENNLICNETQQLGNNMKLAIYIDTENKNDISDLAALCKAINSDKTSSEDLKRYIQKVVNEAMGVKK